VKPLPAFTRPRLRPLIWLVALGVILGPAFAVRALAQIDAPAAGGTASTNLLSAAQSTFEGNAGGWVNGGTAVVTAITTGAHTGVGSLAVTSTSAAGTTSTMALSGGGSSSLTPATPGSRYTAQLWVTAATIGRDVSAGVWFTDKSGNKLGNAIGQVVHDGVGTWVQTPAAVGIAPPTAAFVTAGVAIKGALSGESHVIDDVTLTTAPGSSAAIVGPLTTSGNKILDARGNAVTLRGFNRIGMEGSGDTPGADEMAHAKAWGANFIRLPLSEASWLPGSCTYDASYATKLDGAVSAITSQGMLALLDLHTNRITSCGPVGRQPMADYPNSLTFWQQVATRYASNPLVAFDLYNEPHDLGDAVWRNGGTITWQGTTFQAAGMQQMYNAVRGTGAKNLVFVSGSAYGNAIPTTAPLAGVNIVYSLHAYTCASVPPPSCASSTPYAVPSFVNNWVAPSKSYPVVVGEFGFPNPDDGTYNANLIAFAEAHGWGWALFTWGDATWGPFDLLATAGAGATYEPKAGGMPALAAFPGLAPPLVSTPTTGTLTNNGQVTVSGTALANTTVAVYDGSSQVASTTASSSGAWSTTVSLADGVHTLTATLIDARGGVSVASSVVSVTVDTTAPAAPVITATVAGPPTSPHTVTVTGTAEPNSSVVLSDGGSTVATTPADATGAWSATVTLGDGQHALSAVATDAAGNLSAASTAVSVAIDTQAPAAPVISAPTDGSVSKSPTTTIAGTAEAGSTVTVLDGTQALTSVVVDSSGAWSATASLSEGAHALSAVAVDTTGNTSVSSAAVTVVVDTAAPDVPSISTPTDGSALSAPNVTVSGTAEAGASVTVYADGTAVGTTHADAGGAWTLTTSPLGDGQHAVWATATDGAANTSSASVSVQVAVDANAPAAPVITSPDNATVTGGSDVVVAGTAEPNATVHVSDGGAVVATATADGGGAWATHAQLSDGAHTLVATATDAVGNTSATSAGVTITVDTQPPAAPTVTAPVDGAVIATTSLDVSGATEAGATVTVTVDGATAGVVATDAAGAWSLSVIGLADGAHAVSATAVDTVGNISAASAVTHVVVDTTAPDVPVITSPSDGSTTNTHNITVGGTAEPGMHVQVHDGVALLGTALSGSDGGWSMTASLADGTHQLVVRAADDAGNASTDSAPVQLSVDTTAPAPPQLTAPAAGALTSNTTVVVSGAAEPGSAIRIYDGTVRVGAATADDTGAWTTTLTLTDGVHTFGADATDAAGNTSATSPARAITVDTTAPGAPLLLAPADGALTSSAQVLVRGTAEAGAHVTVTVDNNATASASAAADGTWSTTAALADGAHTITATATDAAGNTSQTSLVATFVVDSTAPAAPTLTAPADGTSTTATTVPVAGHSEPGSSVTIFDGTSVVAHASADTVGNFSVQTPALSGGVHSFTATATDAAGNTSVASAATHLTVDTTSTDLSVTLTAPSTSYAGAGTTATATVTNSGPGAATGVVATVTLPTTATLSSATTTVGTCSVTTPTATCTVGNLAAGASATITLTFTPNKSGASTIAASVKGTQTDRVATNNNATASLTTAIGNGRIAFTTARDGNNEIYSMKPDGTGATRLTNNTASDTDPAWSRDGSKIAFTSNRGGNTDIYYAKSDGTGVTRVTTNTAVDNHPSWSPDGTKLAFTSNRGGNTDIYLTTLNGATVTRLTTATGIDDRASWSPDGSKIAFTSTRDGNTEIYVMKSDGTGVVRLTNNTVTDDAPSWSPDGTKLTYSSALSNGTQVWVMYADGSRPTVLTSTGTNTEPAYSPTGLQITFTSTRSGNADIYVMNADGSAQTRLTTVSAADTHPAWQALL
jgi:Tol biopolymer transport system component